MTKAALSADGLRPADDLAPSGWLVELSLVFAGSSVERRYFAVGLERASDAEEAVLRYPGITPRDRRKAMRLLTPIELDYLALRQDTICPFGCSINSRPRE
jgi:hypothetical protein